tara:strand:- start:12 stop:506 length:495 start_codon:yes stop_codon:yes gene_type:complete
MTEFEDFDLKEEWNLWYHELNDNNWSIDSYQNILSLKKYSDVLFMIKSYENINCGMFFLMKKGIEPIYEDNKNINGGYWSIRVTKKDSSFFWKKFTYYLCIDNITGSEESDKNINGLSISPKINNNIFKVWNCDYKGISKDAIRNDLSFIKRDEFFYLEHKENK